MGQATLGEIKEYLKEKGIDLTPSAKSMPENQTNGDPYTEKCFLYYVEHSTEIEEWRANRKKEKANN